MNKHSIYFLNERLVCIKENQQKSLLGAATQFEVLQCCNIEDMPNAILSDATLQQNKTSKSLEYCLPQAYNSPPHGLGGGDGNHTPSKDQRPRISPM